SKRTGPALARVGGRYSDDWHRVHLINPRDVVPESNMPSYPWLDERMVDPEQVTSRMRALQKLGDPYSDEQIAEASEQVAGKTELDAVVAYLQGLGRNAPRGQWDRVRHRARGAAGAVRDRLDLGLEPPAQAEF